MSQFQRRRAARGWKTHRERARPISGSPSFRVGALWSVGFLASKAHGRTQHTSAIEPTNIPQSHRKRTDCSKTTIKCMPRWLSRLRKGSRHVAADRITPRPKK